METFGNQKYKVTKKTASQTSRCVPIMKLGVSQCLDKDSVSRLSKSSILGVQEELSVAV